MLPKKIYLNYVDEDDEYKTWSEDPVYIHCDMQNREYTDLSQVWHDAKEEPKPHRILLCEVRNGFQVVSWTHTGHPWFWWVKNTGIVKWLYICELLPRQKSIVKQNNR